MTSALDSKRIILAVSGGIAAYKSAELLRLLSKAGAHVRVVMTAGAQSFVQPMTFQALSGHPVHSELFSAEAEAAMGHIELAKWTELIIVAPATAHCMGKLAHGLADDLLSTISLATSAPIALAPAMNQAMWSDMRTQANVRLCEQAQMHIIAPEEGAQACGDVGPGRMAEPSTIVQELARLCTPRASAAPLATKHLLITAGPTREAIDPVRFLSNPSSGKMGFALARAGAALGAHVSLVAGPVNLATPEQVTRYDVHSAQQMFEQVNALECDLFIACAAVADYRPSKQQAHKIKKQADELALTLVRNPDILAHVSQRQTRPFCVGFAAETQALEHNALAKLKAKNLDMIIANNVAQTDTGFASEHNRVSVFSSSSSHNQLERRDFERTDKQTLAHQLMLMIAQQYTNHLQS